MHSNADADILFSKSLHIKMGWEWKLKYISTSSTKHSGNMMFHIIGLEWRKWKKEIVFSFALQESFTLTMKWFDDDRDRGCLLRYVCKNSTRDWCSHTLSLSLALQFHRHWLALLPPLVSTASLTRKWNETWDVCHSKVWVTLATFTVTYYWPKRQWLEYGTGAVTGLFCLFLAVLWFGLDFSTSSKTRSWSRLGLDLSKIT